MNRPSDDDIREFLRLMNSKESAYYIDMMLVSAIRKLVDDIEDMQLRGELLDILESWERREKAVIKDIAGKKIGA